MRCLWYAPARFPQVKMMTLARTCRAHHVQRSQTLGGDANSSHDCAFERVLLPRKTREKHKPLNVLLLCVNLFKRGSIDCLVSKGNEAH